MSSQFTHVSGVGDKIDQELFGGNILANRGELFGDGQYEEAIDDLGVTSLRYPGGTLTEHYFDITNPDAEFATSSVTGEVKPFIPLSEFMNYAEAEDMPVTLVVPTLNYLSETRDANGDRYAEVDEGAVRTFISDVLSGKYGDPEIHAIEIGNEYFHSASMTAVEYGRVASTMAKIIDEEIDRHAESQESAQHIDVIVQMGYNYGTSKISDTYEDSTTETILTEIEQTYDLELGEDATFTSGHVDFTHVINEIIIAEFQEANAIESIDGVVAHVYTLGDENTWSRVFELRQLEDTWLKQFPELETYVTEWNMRGVTEALDSQSDYGLFQSKEMLNIVEEFVTYGVDYAHVWPLIQNTDNALNKGFEYNDTNAPGAMFKMMAEHLPGKTMLDFAAGDHRISEAVFDEISVHGFIGQSDLVLYLTPNGKDGVSNTDLDLSELFSGYDDIEISILGVQTGALPGSNQSAAEVEIVNPVDFFENGYLDLPLDPGEIVQLVVKGIEPVGALKDLMEQMNKSEVIDDIEDLVLDDLPTVPLPPDSPDEEDGDNDEDPGDDMFDDFGLGWLLALLPLVALLPMLG